jgi:hypothetical protein
MYAHRNMWASWQQMARTCATKERPRGPYSTTCRTIRAAAAFANGVHTIEITQ